MSRRAALVALAVILAVVAAACGDKPQIPPTTYAGCRLVPGTSCVGAKLDGLYYPYADLSGANLSGARMSSVDFTGVDFRGADLRGAVFFYATLHAADFTGADLTGAVFNVVDAGQAVLSDRQISELGFQCTVVLPDGGWSNSSCPITSGTLPAYNGPPVIKKFEPTKPVVCNDDFRGRTLEVTYKAEHYASLQIFSDGVLVANPVFGTGTLTVPFECDGTPHTLVLQANGTGAPVTKTLTLRLRPVVVGK